MPNVMAVIINLLAVVPLVCVAIHLYVAFEWNVTRIMTAPPTKLVLTICASIHAAIKIILVLRMPYAKPYNIVLFADVLIICHWVIPMLIVNVARKSRYVGMTVIVPAV